MSQIQTAASKEVALGFMWRDRAGNLHHPCEMETRHLWFTLRMIWNHSMPTAYKIHPYTNYSFTKFYTEEYMKQAILKVGAELLMRDDMKPEWKAELQHMKESFDLIFKLMIGRD